MIYLRRYLLALGWNNKEIEVYIGLYKLGARPASMIARSLEMERTRVYKTLLRMVEQGIITQTIKRGVKHFWVPDIKLLQTTMDQQILEMTKVYQTRDHVEAELQSITGPVSMVVPKITLFEGTEGVKQIYRDIYDTTIQSDYINIKFFASNTFESQMTAHDKLKLYTQGIFTKLTKQGVTVDIMVANGGLVMEHIVKHISLDRLAQLPAGNSSINFCIVGKSIYLIIYKQTPFGIKIASDEFAAMMHFMFDHLKIQNSD